MSLKCPRLAIVQRPVHRSQGVDCAPSLACLINCLYPGRANTHAGTLGGCVPLAVFSVMSRHSSAGFPQPRQVGHKRLNTSLCSNLSLYRIMVRTGWRPITLFHTKLTCPCLHELSVCAGVEWRWNRWRSSQTVPSKIQEWNFLNESFHL